MFGRKNVGGCTNVVSLCLLAPSRIVTPTTMKRNMKDKSDTTTNAASLLLVIA